MIMLIVAIIVILSAAVPIAFVIVPFIMDLANGRDVTSDIYYCAATQNEG